MKNKQYISFNKINNQKYDVIFENGIKLGELLMDCDGYFYFWFERCDGSWESWVLRIICDKMDEINKPWNDEIYKYFNEHP